MILAGKGLLIALPAIALAVLAQVLVLAAPPSVNPVSPSDGSISPASNVTFVCNASDDHEIYNISLFTDVNGTFSIHDSKLMFETEADSSTTLACRFEESYTCRGGEDGTGTGTDFVTTRFGKGVRINDTDTLTYPTGGNLNFTKGSLELWITPYFNTSDTSSVAYLSTDAFEGGNRIVLYSELTDMKFEFMDAGDYVVGAQASASWQEGERHHVALIWDLYNGTESGYEIDLFVDGSNSSTSYYDFGFVDIGSSFGTNMYVGSDNAGGQQQVAAYDELLAFDRVLNASEISTTYEKGMSSHSNESVNWTVAAPDGDYAWACLAYDNESEGSWSSNMTLHVDASTPPLINSITLSPFGYGDVDPGVNITVTANVSDTSNVSSVILRWRETSWVNDTMNFNNVTGLYENATIVTDQTGGTYYYMVCSNDTLGHFGCSAASNITATWDYTWNLTPHGFGSVYGFVGCTECQYYVGTLVLNNTGDDSLDFTLSHDWPLSVSNNVTSPFSTPFPLGPKESVHINVTANFAGEPGESSMTIGLNASHGSQTPVPEWEQLTTTMITYSGGPYCDNDDVYFVLYPENAYQSSSYNLSAKLKNIGNETATGVWINWTLPSGWANASGNLSRYMGDLNGTAGGSNIAWNNITVYLPPESQAGVQNLSVAVSSSSNCSANKSVSVYVLCSSGDGCGSGCSYVTDSDCSIPQTPGGGGTTITSISGIAKEYKITLAIPPRFDINRGETKTLRIGVSNAVSGTVLKSVRLSLSGYPQTFTGISPAFMAEIREGETKYFEAEIKAPVYATYGEYGLNVTVAGTFFEGSKNTTSERSVTMLLVTHKFVGNETSAHFAKAQKALDEMKKSGLETKQMEEIIDEMNASIEAGNYDRVGELSESVLAARNLAFDLGRKMKELGSAIELIKGQNANLPETEKMLSLAVSAFSRGDYGKADERLSSTMLMFAVESGNSALWIFVSKYWWLLGPAVLCSGAGAFAAMRRLARSSLEKRLATLVDEERVIRGLVEDLQKEYFVERKKGAEGYAASMKNYENGLSEIRRKRTEALARLSGKMKPADAVRRLAGEEKRIKGTISDTQEMYFGRGVIGKAHYDNAMKDLRWELLEVQRIRDLKGGGHA